MKALGEALDHLVEQGKALVAETVDAAVVSQLSQIDADALKVLCLAAGWEFSLFDRAGEPLDATQPVPEGFGPYRLHMNKPPVAPGVLQLLTRSGLRRALQEDNQAPIWAVFGFTGQIPSGKRVLQGWDESIAPVEIPATKSPRRLVREYTQIRRVPIDVRLWLTGELEEASFSQPAAQIWVAAATAALIACLPSEIDPDDARLKFRGPPRLELSWLKHDEEPLGRDAFNTLQCVVAWIFENEREAELRHTLLAGELARSGSSQGGTLEFLKSHLKHALESAQIAYQMSLSETARDTLKVLGELRKTVTDETAKLSEMSRQLTGAVSAAVATGIGLVAARVAANAPSVLIVSIVLVVLVYIAMIIASGIRFMQLQRSLRSEWQHRLYRFLPNAEYTTLVTEPTRRAERSFMTTAWLGGAAVVALSLACGWFAFVDGRVGNARSQYPAVKSVPGVSLAAVPDRPTSVLHSAASAEDHSDARCRQNRERCQQPSIPRPSTSLKAPPAKNLGK